MKTPESEAQPILEYAIGFTASFSMRPDEMHWTVWDLDREGTAARLEGYRETFPDAKLYRRPHITDDDWEEVEA